MRYVLWSLFVSLVCLIFLGLYKHNMDINAYILYMQNDAAYVFSTRGSVFRPNTWLYLLYDPETIRLASDNIEKELENIANLSRFGDDTTNLVIRGTGLVQTGDQITGTLLSGNLVIGTGNTGLNTNDAEDVDLGQFFDGLSEIIKNEQVLEEQTISFIDREESQQTTINLIGSGSTTGSTTGIVGSKTGTVVSGAVVSGAVVSLSGSITGLIDDPSKQAVDQYISDAQDQDTLLKRRLDQFKQFLSEQVK